MAHVGLLELVACGVLSCCGAGVGWAQEAAVAGSRPSAEAEEGGGAQPPVFDEVVSSPGLALQWPAKQQRDDGRGVAFREHADGKEELIDASATHVTGLVLLSLLGDGQTHLKGAHHFAQRLLFRLGPETWKRWLTAFRPAILERQIREGDRKGSWFDKDDVQAKTGGRIAQTALDLMALQVYFRHLLVHQCLVRETADDDFGR
jgi:hypothetical protein